MASTHKRSTLPMLDSPRCGARTRSGSPCRSPAVAGKNRCRMHGGAKGSGAPRGNKNALKHGAFTATHSNGGHGCVGYFERLEHCSKSSGKVVRIFEDWRLPIAI